MSENYNVVLYTLDRDGQAPDSIVDGGYYAVENNFQPPRDNSIIGISSGITTENTPSNILQIFNTKDDLYNYLVTVLPEKTELFYYETVEVSPGVSTEISGIKTTMIDPEQEANEFWSRLDEYQ
jgi:hypothetical protein